MKSLVLPTRILLSVACLLTGFEAFAEVPPYAMLIEFQEASTNRYKTGHQSLNGSTNWYLRYIRNVIYRHELGAGRYYYFTQQVVNEWSTEFYRFGACFECEGQNGVELDPVNSAHVEHTCAGMDELCEATMDQETMEWSAECGGTSCFAECDNEDWADCGSVPVTDDHVLIRTCCDIGDEGAVDSWEEILEDLYTTGELISLWQADLESYPLPEDDPNKWLQSGAACKIFCPTEKCISGSRMCYRIRFIGPACEKGKVEWTERFTKADGTIVDTPRELAVEFTGTEQTSEIYYVEPPNEPGCITEIPGCTTGNCFNRGCTHGEAQLAGSCGPNPMFTLSPDRLYINPLAPLTDLYTPAALGVFKADTNVVIVLDGNNISQVRSTNGLVDISVTSDYGYDINFWTQHGGDPLGPYDTNQAIFVAKWTVTRTSQSPFTLRVAKQGGPTVDYIFENGAWTTSEAGGLRQRTDTVTRNTEGYLLSHTLTRNSAGGPIVSQRVRTYLDIGNNQPTLLFTEVNGQAPATVTNRWFYYDDLAPSRR